jgi:serine/threonine-protein kinase
MNSLVERVIMRCLANDPKDRPHSAIAVAAALPGGDPLALALAAGETPSPEMVAEAGDAGGLRPAVAVPCLAAMVIGTVVIIAIASSLSLLRLVPLDKPPAVLVDRVEQISGGLGYDEKPVDRMWGLRTDYDYLEHIRNTDDSADRWDRLSTGQPAAIRFRYRGSTDSMAPEHVNGRIAWNDPPFLMPGMIRARLDPQGRLILFEAVPPGRDIAGDRAPSAPEWSGLFADAGLDPAAFTATTPEWTPPMYCDTRAAWLGVYPDAPETVLRVEAGAYAGTPVYFRLIAPWEEPPGSPSVMDIGEKVGSAFFVTLFCVIPVAAGLIAWRHLRAGRGDRRGAARLALYVFAIAMGHWLFTADHVLAFDEMGLVIRAFGSAAGFAVVCWLLYLAIEPYARRYWPHAIISWTRLLAGRFRDPLVGRDNHLLDASARRSVPRPAGGSRHPVRLPRRGHHPRDDQRGPVPDTPGRPAAPDARRRRQRGRVPGRAVRDRRALRRPDRHRRIHRRLRAAFAAAHPAASPVAGQRGLLSHPVRALHRRLHD